MQPTALIFGGARRHKPSPRARFPLRAPDANPPRAGSPRPAQPRPDQLAVGDQHAVQAVAQHLELERDLAARPPARSGR